MNIGNKITLICVDIFFIHGYSPFMIKKTLPLFPNFLMLCMHQMEQISPNYFSYWGNFWHEIHQNEHLNLPRWVVCEGNPPLEWMSQYITDYPDPYVLSVARLTTSALYVGQTMKDIQWSAFFILSLFIPIFIVISSL